MSRGIQRNPTTYRIMTVETSNQLVFSFDAVNKKGRVATSLYELIRQIDSIQWLYTHRNGNMRDNDLIPRSKLLDWLKDSSS